MWRTKWQNRNFRIRFNLPLLLPPQFGNNKTGRTLSNFVSPFYSQLPWYDNQRICRWRFETKEFFFFFFNGDSINIGRPSVWFPNEPTHLFPKQPFSWSTSKDSTWSATRKKFWQYPRSSCPSTFRKTDLHLSCSRRNSSSIWPSRPLSCWWNIFMTRTTFKCYLWWTNLFNSRVCFLEPILFLCLIRY